MVSKHAEVKNSVYLYVFMYMRHSGSRYYQQIISEVFGGAEFIQNADFQQRKLYELNTVIPFMF